MKSFPFTAIVGMKDAKLSLIYHAIDPKIGGTLLLGNRGSAKSTLARAFGEILSMHESVPFVELPLGATEDRLLGSVNAEALVEQNQWRSRPGLLEEANGGILYVDEVNLLSDYLADHILDSAASGRYQLERDGFKRTIESRYILIGTMNPEEGELRPQLLDRFAHGIVVRDDFSPDERMEAVDRRIRFDDDPESFVRYFLKSEMDLSERIKNAKDLVQQVFVSKSQRLAIAERARQLNLEGLRAEIAVLRTIRCAAAWNGRTGVEQNDIDEAWRMVLGHRQPQTRDNIGSPPVSSSGVTKFTPPQRQALSMAPVDAVPDSITLNEPRKGLVDFLKIWMKNDTERNQNKINRSQGSRTKTLGGPIDWINSILCSYAFFPRDVEVQNSKESSTVSRHQFRLCYRIIRSRPHIWCFLDASRSTGMNQFLAHARDALSTLSKDFPAFRWSLLVLLNGKVHWVNRNSSYKSFENELNRIREASGKSYLITSLTALSRAIVRCGVNKDRVIMVSDGLASPENRGGHSQSAPCIRERLKRIVQAGAKIIWIYPSNKRGLSRWIEQLTRRLPITLTGF